MNSYLMITLSGVVALLITVGILYILIRKNNNRIETGIKKFMEVSENSSPTMNLNERLKFTTDILSLLDELIATEIINERRFELFLSAKNKNLDVDEVIKNVSTRVFKAIKPQIYIHPDNILDDNYFMTYIQKKTFIEFMTFLTNGDDDTINQE